TVVHPGLDPRLDLLELFTVGPDHRTDRRVQRGRLVERLVRVADGLTQLLDRLALLIAGTGLDVLENIRALFHLLAEILDLRSARDDVGRTAFDVLDEPPPGRVLRTYHPSVLRLVVLVLSPPVTSIPRTPTRSPSPRPTSPRPRSRHQRAPGHRTAHP